MMLLDRETIVAVATPPGRGGIGVVRVSGVRALACTAALLRLREALVPGHARLTHVVDGDGVVLDEAVVTYFEGPHSYTSEDVVEISAHGAPVLLEWLVRGAIAGGARLAEPGEFTQRAFLSGRIDLTQAEAVHDLVSAQTLHQAKLAAAQMGGSIARIVKPLKQGLVELVAALEAGVDFAEDDLDLLSEGEITRRIEALLVPLRGLAKSYGYGRIVREGVRLAIVGRPNAGKSSLFNRLLERERAIVTALPGTTRDPIAERMVIGGIPFELIDTAGLRAVGSSAEEEAEREGIARSRTTMDDADVVLHVVDATTVLAGALSADDAATQVGLAGRASLLVLNKADLALGSDGHEGLGGWLTSATTGDGVEALKQGILERVGGQPMGDSAMITNVRQSQAIEAAVGSLEKARDANEHSIPHEFLLFDLHEALEALDTLTGTTTPDAILNVIFSSFCIGK